MPLGFHIGFLEDLHPGQPDHVRPLATLGPPGLEEAKTPTCRGCAGSEGGSANPCLTPLPGPGARPEHQSHLGHYPSSCHKIPDTSGICHQPHENCEVDPPSAGSGRAMRKKLKWFLEATRFWVGFHRAAAPGPLPLQSPHSCPPLRSLRPCLQ